MKKILLLLLFPFSVNAQQEFLKPVICSSTTEVIRFLTGENYRELPVWIGKADNEANFSLFVNAKTKTWTVLEIQDNIACIIGSGENSRLNNNLLNSKKS